jgi:hypothetical protein
MLKAFVQHEWVLDQNYVWLLHSYEIYVDAFLSSLLDPLKGLSMVNCEKLELGGTPNFQH